MIFIGILAIIIAVVILLDNKDAGKDPDAIYEKWKVDNHIKYL